MSGWLDRPRGLFTHGEWIVILALVVVGAFQVFVLGRNGRSPERLPQLVRGDDALAVAFGGARETISLAMVHKADSYFHGGVDMECTLDHDHDEDGDGDHEHGDGCVHDHDHDHGHGTESNGQTIGRASGSFDPWAWINMHVRAPEVERHLEGAKAVELMPWLWAAVKSDPHNAEAWSVAWYTASHVMKDKALAAKVLAEAKAKNPDSIEIAFTEGRAFYDGGKGDLAAAKRLFERTVGLAEAKCGGDVSKLTSREEESYRFARNYLKSIAEKIK